MKKNIAISLMLALAAFSAIPATALADGLFVEGRVGRSDFDNYGLDDNDTAFAINGGYRWGAFGLEAGYVDLGEFDRNYIGAGKHGVSMDGWTLGANGHFNLNEHWYLSARAGLFHWNADIDTIPVNGPRMKGDTDSTDWYAGVGVGYDINANWGVGINYDHYAAEKGVFDFDVNKISLSTEYRF
ncbi:porin family protein [Tahibacter amnicola]|uniref:Porin family protein n=1 Tax=Tahibacter amnicola TaxID=2976241 RepID=A0ABY6BLP7_9GAMM|nr:porin family protein [Tahibacter amnicola]UXI69491.1 porin family protein [Tahibacter amnicola]